MAKKDKPDNSPEAIAERLGVTVGEYPLLLLQAGRAQIAQWEAEIDAGVAAPELSEVRDKIARERASLVRLEMEIWPYFFAKKKAIEHSTDPNKPLEVVIRKYAKPAE